ncbi:hypothetical protein [Loigolactobacillus zhaoyuanensis]|uniref:Uncharacterized protein n=1 Tax=Loigolactobacillus zhaoyuanensis TaxID=2486017 RepID=A0ABW8UD70_9LACO|nr:hypothetical protein [Loigolactobacillus zhaoyuanensis]
MKYMTKANYIQLIAGVIGLIYGLMQQNTVFWVPGLILLVIGFVPQRRRK